MINKEAVKQRLNRDDSGISFTEFSYNLLQAYDFACLNKITVLRCKSVVLTSGEYYLRY